mmetsp:Transcript_21188/g.52120  ORF Transcript_21188/g.52120 Transcript_21188/m.52120 type:complete len:497 (-) Transcript_21188:6029-7519(-)
MEAEDNTDNEYGSCVVNEAVKRDEIRVLLTMDMDEAIERLGHGRFQKDILLAAGLCFAADAMEVLLLSFLSMVLKAEWGLTDYQENTVISIVFAGAAIGTLILSPLADIVGRRRIFAFTAATISVFGILTAFCSTYEWLLFARFMVGFGVGGLTVPFDTLAEFVPNSQRGANLLEIEYFWTAGTISVPVVAWLTLGDSAYFESWRLFVLICALPCLASAVVAVLLVPESPRWLVAKGSHAEALRILRGAAARNGLDPFEVYPKGTKILEKFQTKESICDLFSAKWLKITLLLWSVWGCLAILYYGVIIAVTIVFSSQVEIHDDDSQEASYDFDFGAILISASAEIVGLQMAMFTIDHAGRIKTQTFSYLLGGVSCLLLLLVASINGPRSMLLVFAFLSRMAMMGASCTTWVSTSEILSTDIRATGHGTANSMARLAGIVTPYIINDKTSLNMIGLFIFSISIVTAAATWHLPETAGMGMGVHGARRDEAQYSNMEE